MLPHALVPALLACLPLVLAVGGGALPEIVTLDGEIRLDGGDVTMRVRDPPLNGQCPATRPVVSLSELVCNVGECRAGLEKTRALWLASRIAC